MRMDGLRDVGQPRRSGECPRIVGFGVSFQQSHIPVIPNQHSRDGLHNARLDLVPAEGEGQHLFRRSKCSRHHCIGYQQIADP